MRSGITDRTWRWALMLLILPFIYFTSHSQPVASQMLVTKKGYTRIFNEEGQWFTLSYSGDSIRSYPGDITEIDGDLFQFRFAAANPAYSNLLNKNDLTGNDYTDVTKGFIQYEIRRIRDEVLGDFVADSIREFRMTNGRSWFIWSYWVPDSLQEFQRKTAGKSIRKNIVFTTLANTTLFSLAAPVFEEKNEASLLQKMKALASGLQVYPDEIEVDILSQRFGAKAPEGVFFAHPLNCESGFLSPDELQFLRYGEQGSVRAVFPEKDYSFATVELLCFSEAEFPSLDSVNGFFKKVMRGGTEIPSGRKEPAVRFENRNCHGQYGLTRRQWLSFETDEGWGVLYFDCPEDLFSFYESRLNALVENLGIR